MFWTYLFEHYNRGFISFEKHVKRTDILLLEGLIAEAVCLKTRDNNQVQWLRLRIGKLKNYSKVQRLGSTFNGRALLKPNINNPIPAC